MSDLISREKAIEDLQNGDPSQLYDIEDIKYWINSLPSAESERLSDDDFETIRIHLNAYKEKLCNQQRWEEAEEYQRIIDRFMAFVSADSEIIRCRDCKHWETTWTNDFAPNYHYCPLVDGTRRDDFYCADAELRGEEDEVDRCGCTYP